MPRDITIRFDDGSTHVYRKAPDDVSPEQLKARAQRDFPSRGIVGISGAPQPPAAPPPASAPAAPRRPAAPAAPLLTPEGRIPSIQGRTQAYARQVMAPEQPLLPAAAERAASVASLFSDPSGRLRPAPPKPVAPPAPAAPEPSKGFEIGNVLRGTGEATADVAGGLLRAIGLVTGPVGDVLQRGTEALGIPTVIDFEPLTPEQIAAGRKLGDPYFRRATEADYGRAGGVLPVSDAVSGLDLGYTPGTTFEDVKRDPLGNVLPFIGEQGIASLPAMALAAASTPALAVSQTGSIAQQRAENDARQQATILDAAAAAPAAVGSALLERLGIDKIMKAGGGTAAKRIFGAATGEALTEAPQSMIEYAGGTLGTEAGLDPAQMLEQGAAGALVGLGVGGGIRGTIEAPGAAANAAQRGAELMTALKARAAPQGAPSAPVAPPEAPVAPEPPQAAPAPAPEPQAAVAPTPPEQAASSPAASAPAAPVVAPGPAAAPPPAATPVPGGGGIAPTSARIVGAETSARVPGDLTKVRMQFEIHDLSNLVAAEGELQNRDRSRPETQDFLREFVSKFDPEILGEDKFTDRGAPIINKDNVILSGNGRTMGLEEVYNQSPEGAAAYRKFLQDQGYDVEGIERPVLVRRVLDDVDERKFVTGSNANDKANLSAPEQARQDASDVMTDDVLALYTGGDLTKAGNDRFVSAFLAKLTARDRGSMMDDRGAMSTKGIDRINNALLHKAFGDQGDISRNFMSRAMERTDDDSKTLTKSLGAIAPDWVKFLRDMREGLVDPKYNIADKILEAVALVGDIKARGLKVKQYLEMDDMFTGEIDPFIRDILLAFHKNDLSGFKSMKAIGEVLRSYIKEASDQQAGEDLLGPTDTPSPEAVWRAVDRVAQGDDEATLLDTGDFNDADGTAQRDEGGDQGQPQEGRQARGQQQAGAREGRNRGARTGRGAQDRGDREGLGDQPPGRGVPTTGSVPSRGEIGGPPTIPNLTEALAALEEEEPAPAPAADVLEDAPAEDRSGITGDDKGGYADTFMEASFTNRRSVYETAINDLGMDPAKFTLLPTQRQKKLLADAFYKRFGIKIVFYGGLQDRKAIDQILDAYQTVQGMASVLGISERAMALGGKLQLRLQKKGKFLGAYDPGPRMIMLPGRSNSFAHEWFHALDFYLMDELINGDPLGGGLTGSTRGGNQYQASPELREAWSNFLNAMFFDKAGMAQKILVLEAKIQATKSAAQKAAFQRQIDNLKRGTSSSKDIRSKFYKSAATVNPGDYWTKPTEMGARAFEAYVSMMAAQASLGTEFIGKGDFNYRANPEERFVKTFPKASERQAIFEAISAVMIALHNDQVIGGDGDPASLPPVTALRKVTDFDRMVSTEPNGSLIQREMDAWQRRMRRKAEEAAGRAAGQKSGLQRAMDILALFTFSMAGKLKMLEARYQSPTIRKIHDMLAYVPGAGERVGETFAEEVEGRFNRNINRLGNILKKHGLEDMTAADQRKLRDMLINEGDLNDPENQAMVRAAADIRILMDELFYDASNVGIDMGYVRHGYLPRTLDMPKVLNDGLAFVEKATRVYEIVWDNTVGPDPDEMVNRDNLAMFLRTAKRLGVDGVDDIRKLIKKANAIQSKDDPDAAMAAQMKAWDEIMERIGEIWDEVRTGWATESANAWHDALITASGYDFDAHSPENSFTKKRELPPEADKIMEDFYVHNPVEAIHDYIAQSARRVAYVRRMGTDSKIRDSLIEGMSADGVSKEDQQEVLKVMDIAMGRQQSGMPRSAEIGLSALQFYGVIRLLPRAVLSSLVEPITAGITAGDFRVGFVALASAMAGSRTMAGKERAELARAMGIVTDQMGHIMADNRIGGTFADATRFDRMSQAMFERTGLVALTRAQRSHMLAVSHAYLDNLSQKALDGDERAISLLKELGVRDPAAFAKEFLAKNRMPTVDELTTKWGADYSLASRRFIDMTIQNPNGMHRPQMANNPVGRIVYGIMSFSMAFWRNVTKRQLLMIRSEFKRGGVKAASVQALVRLAPSAMALFVMQATISTLREYFLNPERWEELKKEGELEETMLKLGLTRSFSMGILDPFIQAYTGLRYQRDLSSMFVGPSGSVILTDLAKIISLFARNSKKTNTGEYNAVEAGYNLLIGPAIATGLTMMPAGPILTPIAGAGIAYVTSPRMGDTVATAVVGEKGTKTPSKEDDEE